MSKTALVEALRSLDVDDAARILDATPALRDFRNDKGLDLLQICCSRETHDDPPAATRQLRLAKWLVSEGFNPRAIHTTARGEDGDAPAEVSLVWFAVAKAQNNRLARYFLDEGARPEAFFAAAWWGNGEILADLVRHGANINVVVGATPLHMAVDVVQRGVEGKPERARRRLQCVKELLRLGADPNIPARDRTTPLHTALKKEYLEAFELLLRHGANPDIPGKDGRTVREIASRKKDRRYLNAISTLSRRSRR
jgi:Ankyrin repeats (many copies)